MTATAIYDNAGLSFQYPTDWGLEESEADDASFDEVYVTVTSPGGAFWTVMQHPEPDDPWPYLDAALGALREEYDDLEVEEAEDAIAGRRLYGYDVSFFYLDLVTTARIRGVRTPQSTLLFFCQADDHELDEVGGQFRQITASLLENEAEDA